jgi:hypothetical protein
MSLQIVFFQSIPLYNTSFFCPICTRTLLPAYIRNSAYYSIPPYDCFDFCIPYIQELFLSLAVSLSIRSIYLRYLWKFFWRAILEKVIMQRKFPTRPKHPTPTCIKFHIKFPSQTIHLKGLDHQMDGDIVDGFG